MKKGEIVEGVIDRYSFPNKGSMVVEGERISVKGALPGQRVRARVKRNGGNLTEIVERADYETDPMCEHFPDCGGCAYQTVPYEKQLEIKKRQIEELIGEAYPEEFTLENIYASPRPVEYRNKMEFSFGDAVKDGPLTLGLHKRASTYDVLSVTGCVLVDSDVRKVLKTVLDFYAGRDIPYYKKMAHEGILRHLLVRKSTFTGQMLVALVSASGERSYEELAAYLKLEELTQVLTSQKYDGELTGFLHILNNSPADVVVSEKTTLLYGRDYIEEKLLGLTFKITPFSFFQTNAAGAEVLYCVVRDFLGGERKHIVYDLYSGTGTIAQIVSAVCEKCIGVEIVEEAVIAARENAARNAIDNCVFIAGDVLKVIDTMPERPDVLILDPPRDGIHPKALPKLIDYGAQKVIYISCKPSSFARDLPSFYAAGYRISRIACVDMFPQTPGVECCCLLTKCYKGGFWKEPEGGI